MIGVVDVGGGLRGVYGAGVFDTCLDEGIAFDYLIGVSAGSANVASFLGDYIYMRVEEMYFTAAEAALRLDDLKSARELMNTVMAERDPGYSANNRSGTLLGATTTTWTGSFLENILTHRRIELWGEYGRLFDVRRLGQGIDRRTDDGFSEECISMMNRRNVNITKADTYDWVLTIPKAELDANPNINEEDQNP